MLKKWYFWVGVFVVLGLIGMLNQKKSSGVSATTQPAKDSLITSGATMEIARKDMGADWPLKVLSGTFECKNDALLFHNGGTTYVVNGVARQRHAADHDIVELLDSDPTSSTGLKPIAEFINKGEETCKK